MEQQFSIIYPKIKVGQRIEDENGNIRKIVSIESGRNGLQITRIKNLKNKSILPYSFPEIAALIITKKWKFI